MSRFRPLNDQPVRQTGQHVLYWMTTSRRADHNHGLDRAVERAKQLTVPLVVLEALRCDYPWACDRFHAMILQGMADNRRAFADSPVLHHAYVESQRGAGKGLLQAWAEDACVVVTDDYPTYFLPAMHARAAEVVSCRMEAVDSNGLLPIRLADREHKTAYSFRRFMQRALPRRLEVEKPSAAPLDALSIPRKKMPEDIEKRWPQAADDLLEATPAALSTLPIDHKVAVSHLRGGSAAGRERLTEFVNLRLSSYADDRSHPQRHGTTGLSPWLHFGHISSWEVVAAILKAEQWSRAALADRAEGKRSGWWGLSESAEGLLDQVITWRELGFHTCATNSRHDSYDSLPLWARQTLQDHELDERVHLYDYESLRDSRTHDELWNAAQTQLRQTGVMHNYLRMLWGKKILHWSESPRDALKVMLDLNNRYALDGRDPNSISGIFWVLGRYDRPWGPERPIFGKVRYMSSDSTRRKTRVKQFIAQYT